MFDTAQHIASRGPFLVAKEVLPAMRKRGAGSFFFSNNASSLRGRKRLTGQSLYYPRVMMRTLAQVLTEEYSEHGVHVANVVIDGLIDSPGTRALPRGPAAPRGGDESREDRGGVLLPAHPGQILLDARAPADALSDQAERVEAPGRPSPAERQCRYVRSGREGDGDFTIANSTSTESVSSASQICPSCMVQYSRMLRRASRARRPAGGHRQFHHR